ncbi:unnamed protein product [Parascedosporium putredinis]|uniref:AMP-dependent synthetase/ligase domain-containing protein n=1 Tax=Parascedosporium putredinis TaxID=1442378 RepID=A0A9P1MDA5_9PEZI|nr:unnamed protein product [Parascedosporium putredinis]CAI8002204.1 unnamed protein product [Parascedosporium putredinis]
MASTLPKLPLFDAIARHNPDSTLAVHSLSGRTFKYGELLGDVCKARNKFQQAAGKEDLNGDRIAFLVENSYDYVVTLLAAFAARAIAIPLSPGFPAAELQYILDQSEASLLVSSAKFASKASEVLATELSVKPAFLQLEKHQGGSAHEQVSLENEDAGNAAMMLYTSGTTNRPKGVLLPSSVLTAQSQSLMQAWEYSPADRLLHVLPLHHIHGTVNAILTPLFAGSSIEFMFPFNPDKVWRRFAAPFLPAEEGKPLPEKITFFTVVPTVISGSAALPTPVKKAWADLSRGNILLERYGMTEVGMALSCGLGFADRVDASVGWPLPSVQARLVDVDSGDVIQPGQEIDAQGRERSGEIQLRGPTIFREYWRNPTATASEFVEGEDGLGKWFKTGDVAVRRPVPSAGGSGHEWASGDMYFIQGRKSADIIKSGGERSALSRSSASCSPSPRDRLVNYKIPQVLRVVDDIPRNAMGKINKKQLVKAVFAEEFSGDEM